MTSKNLQKSALIIVENQNYYHDTRVKGEAIALKEAGWRVHVICPVVSTPDHARSGNRLGPGHIAEGISVHAYLVKHAGRGILDYLKEYFLSLIHIGRLSLRIFWSHGFSVVHLCNPPDILFVVGSFYKLLGKKVIFDHHDLFPEMVLTRYRGIARVILYALSRALEFLTFRTADIVVSTNQSYQEVATGRGRVNRAKVFIVRNGPVLAEMGPVRPDPGLKRNFPNMACYAGIMGPEDGVLELIEAINHIIHEMKREDIFFCLLGDGSIRQEALSRVKDWGLEEYVDMPGMIRDKDLYCRYLSTAEIALAPERSNPLNDKSTFIKISEYMALERPIVAYDLKETRHTAGDAAVYVSAMDIKEYGKSVVGLIDDPERRIRMGRCGRNRVAELFRWAHQKGCLLEAYDAALSS